MEFYEYSLGIQCVFLNILKAPAPGQQLIAKVGQRRPTGKYTGMFTSTSYSTSKPPPVLLVPAEKDRGFSRVSSCACVFFL